MKKISLGFLLLVVFLSTFADTTSGEEVDFLLFMPNSSYQLADEEQEKILDSAANYLLAKNLGPGQIIVAGYAATAANDVNAAELSRNRAIFVMNELQKRGIRGNSFSFPRAYGSVDLWGSNENENERSLNRRVRIFLNGDLPAAGTLPVFEPVIIPASITIANGSSFKFPWFSLLRLFFIISAITTIGLIAMALIIEFRRGKTTKIAIVDLEDEIRQRAYELYLERNGQNGDPIRDWWIAVPEVCARYQAAGFKAYTEDEHWLAREERQVS